MCYTWNYRQYCISSLGFSNHPDSLCVSRISMIGSSLTCKTWMNLFLKITYANKDTHIIYMYVNQTSIYAYKSGKSIKMDSVNSVTQFPTITSRLHV